MARGVNKLCLALCVAAPENEYDMVTVGRYGTYHGVGKLFPSVALVASGSMRAHRKRGVEQQHALFGPSDKASALWHRRAEVGLYFLEYINERGRKRHSVVHGEA